MAHYEIIYETGAYSIAEYQNDKEALAAAEAQNERAVNGLPGGPSGLPAERVKRVLRYKEHPVNFSEGQLLDVKDVNSIINSVAQGDLISVPELTSALRQEVSPLIYDSGPHETNYKMKEEAEIWIGEK